MGGLILLPPVASEDGVTVACCIEDGMSHAMDTDRVITSKGVYLNLRDSHSVRKVVEQLSSVGLPVIHAHVRSSLGNRKVHSVLD